MKKLYLFLSLLTVVIFGTLSVITAKVYTPSDGNDNYGFPYTFLIRPGGKRFPNPTNQAELSYTNLLIDLAFAFLLAVIIWVVYIRLKNRTSVNSKRK